MLSFALQFGFVMADKRDLGPQAISMLVPTCLESVLATTAAYRLKLRSTSWPCPACAQTEKYCILSVTCFTTRENDSPHRAPRMNDRCLALRQRTVPSAGDSATRDPSNRTLQ